MCSVLLARVRNLTSRISIKSRDYAQVHDVYFRLEPQKATPLRPSDLQPQPPRPPNLFKEMPGRIVQNEEKNGKFAFCLFTTFDLLPTASHNPPRTHRVPGPTRPETPVSARNPPSKHPPATRASTIPGTTQHTHKPAARPPGAGKQSKQRQSA